MSSLLPTARDAFIIAMNREIGATERPRYLAVLDALLEWSLARPEQLTFRTNESVKGALSFCRAGTNTVFWSAKPVRADGAHIELLPKSTLHLSEEDRAQTCEALNSMTREHVESNKLRINFGAMKSPQSREAMFALMNDLLAKVH